MHDVSAERYVQLALATVNQAVETQLGVVREVAVLVADALAGGHRFVLFGTGHSHALVEEAWGRAGGLADVTAILEPSLMLHEGLEKSSLFERRTGLASDILKLHAVGPGDVVLIASNSGRNAVPVEFAVLANQAGAVVVALTSLNHSRSVTSREPGGRRLFEVADVVIDNCGVPGDAIVEREPEAVGPTSTVVGALLINALVVEAVAELDRRGVAAPVLRSLNA